MTFYLDNQSKIGHHFAPMSYEALILSVMMAVTPSFFQPQPGTPRMKTYTAIAHGIDSAVLHPIGALPFEGPAATEASAIALAAITYNESGYREDVRTCKIKGDHGRSISVFQLINGPGRKNHTEKEICSDDVLAAQLGLDVLAWYSNVKDAIQLFQGYASGNASVSSYASRAQYRMFTAQAATHNVKIVVKPGASKPYADYITPPVVSSTNGDENVRTLAVTP